MLVERRLQLQGSTWGESQVNRTGVSLDQMHRVNGWELQFGTRLTEDLVVVNHALHTGWQLRQQVAIDRYEIVVQHLSQTNLDDGWWELNVALAITLNGSSEDSIEVRQLVSPLGLGPAQSEGTSPCPIPRPANFSLLESDVDS